jgi:hypothetical protein
VVAQEPGDDVLFLVQQGRGLDGLAFFLDLLPEVEQVADILGQRGLGDLLAGGADDVADALGDADAPGGEIVVRVVPCCRWPP